MSPLQKKWPEIFTILNEKAVVIAEVLVKKIGKKFGNDCVSEDMQKEEEENDTCAPSNQWYVGETQCNLRNEPKSICE